MNVPYLKPSDIDNAAVGLLHHYGERFEIVNAPPVPVEDICERYLKLDIVPGDLRRDFPNTEFGEAIGALDIGEETVFIDSNRNMTEGRRCFTVAHEIGHYELHRKYLGAPVPQGDLFPSNSPISVIICRESNKNEPSEWQANKFAGALLMPKPLLIPHIIDIKKELGIERESNPFDSSYRLRSRLIESVAGAFHTSRIAAEIRLVDLKILRNVSQIAA